MTLIQSTNGLIDNISVTDNQEESIKASVSNLDSNLLKKESRLYVKVTFTNGSYERDTNIRPLDDIDVFVVLDLDEWKDENGNLPAPQSVLTKFKNYLNNIDDYKDKVSQDRPCVTIELSNKYFDVLPSFKQTGGGYLIPNYDLTGWTFTYPEQLTSNLNNVNKLRNYKVKPTIKAIKYWNREKKKLIPSYHIEEVSIAIFQNIDFKNYEESIRLWFNNAEHYLTASKFNSAIDFETTIKRIKKIKDKLNNAKAKYDEGDEDEAILIWKEVFGKEFPTISDDEAKDFAKYLTEGQLRISPSGNLSKTLGTMISASKGFYGDDSEK